METNNGSIDLLLKYIENKVSAPEREKFAELLTELSDTQLEELLLLAWDSYATKEVMPEDRAQRVLSYILSSPSPHAIATPKHRSLRRITIYSVVAACLVPLMLFFIFRSQPLSTLWQDEETVNAHIDEYSTGTTNYIRNITLPDGSPVVLYKNSTISYNSLFSTENRELSLSGEAFFDVVSNPDLPFIVHSGSIRTVVMGTAFTIKAWPNDKHIIVAVTRGKVRVEKGNDVLAVLNTNQQFDYNVSAAKATLGPIVNDNITNLSAYGMVFYQVPLKQIAATLSERYQVKIAIADSKLGEKLIVSSFSGEETLDGILEMLSMIIPEMEYSINGNVVVLHSASK